MKKDKLALFGNGKTTKAIATFLGEGCYFFDDNVTNVTIDELSNKTAPTGSYENENFDYQVTTPSIPPSHNLIQKADNLFSEYDLFLSKESPLKLEKEPFTIWISGTNGKTTTTQMVTHLLKERGAVSGGNIGTPLGNIDKDAPIWVLETSSFTLHHTKYARPNLYLLLPITPDHLDWHGSYEEYEKDKLKPLSNMLEGELAIVPKGLKLPQSNAMIFEYDSIEDIAKYFNIEPDKVEFEGAFLLDSLLALAITKALFEENDYTKMNSFKVDAHRQEKIVDTKGRVWINDSKATNVDAVLEAIKPHKDKKVHLILGGDDKGVDLSDFFKEIKDYSLSIYAIGSNSQKLIDLSKEYNIDAKESKELDVALQEINKVHNKHSVALLSPAASSLDQFSSYVQRGDIFKEFAKEA